MQAAEQYGLGPGRIERRRLWALPMYDDLIDWPGARTLLRLERTFTNKRTGTKSVELDYALSRLGLDQITAADFLALWQAHWHIENKLHWIRDVTLNEDASRVRSGNAPQVLAAIRNTLITAARRAGFANIAEALRAFAQSPFRAALCFVGIG
jgi:hypothetical protein